MKTMKDLEKRFTCEGPVPSVTFTTDDNGTVPYFFEGTVISAMPFTSRR